MITAKCIEKYRDKQNRIYGYLLQDLNGQQQKVKSENLKQAIANNQIHIINLTLTSDGRLVDTTEKQLGTSIFGSEPESKFEEKCEKILDYISKGTGLKFDKSTAEINSKDYPSIIYLITSEPITKIDIRVDLDISPHNDKNLDLGMIVSTQLNSTKISNLSIGPSNDGSGLDELTNIKSLKQLNGLVASLNKIINQYK